jgi:hypothetical protein
MADAPMTLRALGRATLARQMLLARRKTPALRAVEQLVALQAQAARSPFVALWTRVAGFRREHLARALARREVVRATTMRGTLHLSTSDDYAAMRAPLQPMLTQAVAGILRERMKGLDVERVLGEARRFFGAEPRTFAEVRDFLVTRFPRGDERAMGYVVRLHLPLVQVPTESHPWSFETTPDFALAESWLGRPIAAGGGPEAIVARYLAALGPATAADVQSWTGMKDARAVVERLRPELVVLRDDRRRELFDLPGAPRPDGDSPAPPRLLPEFDNVLLGHADRKRFVADEHRSRVYLPGLRVAPTILVDGRIAGTWATERKKDVATLTVQPFARVALRGADRDALHEEATALLRFLEPDAASLQVRSR